MIAIRAGSTPGARPIRTPPAALVLEAGGERLRGDSSGQAAAVIADDLVGDARPTGVSQGADKLRIRREVETGADLDRSAADVLGPRDAYLTFVESRP